MIRRLFANPFLQIAIGFILWVYVGYLTLPFEYLFPRPARIAFWHTLPGTLVWEAIRAVNTLLVVIVLSRLFLKRPLATLFPTPKVAWRPILIGFTISLAITATIYGVMWLTRVYQWLAPYSLFAPLTLLLFTLQIAFLEEIAFRGFVYGALESRYGTRFAAGFSLLLFALFHIRHLTVPSVVSSLWIGLTIGLLLTIARVKTGALWLPIALHWGWDFGIFFGDGTYTGTQVLLFPKYSFTLHGPGWATGGEIGLSGSIIYIGVTLFADFLVWKWLSRPKTAIAL